MRYTSRLCTPNHLCERTGAEGEQDIQTHGDAKQDWLKRYRGLENGIPRCYTTARILKSIVAKSMLEALLNWLMNAKNSR